MWTSGTEEAPISGYEFALYGTEFEHAAHARYSALTEYYKRLSNSQYFQSLAQQCFHYNRSAVCSSNSTICRTGIDDEADHLGDAFNAPFENPAIATTTFKYSEMNCIAPYFNQASAEKVVSPGPPLETSHHVKFLTCPAAVIKKNKRLRTTFSGQQLATLEETYRQEEYIGARRRMELAELLDLTESQIKVWWQNRRIKQRRMIRLSTRNENNGPGSTS